MAENAENVWKNTVLISTSITNDGKWNNRPPASASVARRRTNLLMAKDRVEQSELTRSVEAALLRADLNAADAWTCAETFVLQEMRGVRHHALDLLPDLIEGLTSGAINSNPHREVVSSFGATAVLDGDGGPGIAACRQAMSLSIEAATEHGIGITLVRNSRHFLAGAPYCIAAAEAGMIGAACTNAGASMAYPGTRSPMLSNGPIAYAM